MSTVKTARGRALHRAYMTRGISEQPAGSNCDHRKDGIRAWQRECASGGTYLEGQPWCGVRCFDLLKHAGVAGITSRMASVALIEDDARAHRGPFRGWVQGAPEHAEWEHLVFRGDLLVLFGRGVHVALLRDLVFDRHGRLLFAVTEEGNTSSGAGGSQDNGGITARRIRYPHEIYGAALVNYPGK